MSGRGADSFPQFLRTFVSPFLKARGYKQSGRTYQKTEGQVTARVVFLRYSGARAGRFDVRLSLTLDPYESDLAS